MTLRRTLIFLASALALAGSTIVGCGGGVGSGGTGDFSSNFTYGQITGFGSVIVNGVRFDDSVAQVVDDKGGSRSSGALRLGMTVSVDSDAVVQGSTGPQAKASVVRFGSVLEAPVTAVDLVGGSFVALGQTVRLQASTVFDDSLAAGASRLAVGQVLEVHGYIDVATQSIIATRIESFASTGEYKARGVVTSLDAAARRLRIGASDFTYAAAGDVPAGLAVGQVVTVYVSSTVGPNGVWNVSRFNSGAVSQPTQDHDQADVRGVVTAFTDSRHFVVNGTTVDASSAAFPDGTSFGAGSRVKVEGSFKSGVLLAAKVEIDSDGRVTSEGIDLRGAIDSVDAAAKTLRLRGSTVFYGGSVRFQNGQASDLAAGRQVRVKGKLSGDRTRVEAEEIKFE